MVVNNYGNDTISGFYLNYYMSDYNCYRGFHKLYNTIVLPHDSVTVPTGNFNGSEFPVPANFQPGDIFYRKFCFFTTIPNASNDIYIDNDARCDSVVLTNLTAGMNENTFSAANVNVFPNLFNNSLNIQSDIEIKTALLYNALGITQRQITVNKNELILESDGLPPGIYFIKLQTPKGTVIKKVVKE